MVTNLTGEPLSEIKVGEEVKVLTLFGIVAMTITKVESKSAQAQTKSGGLAAGLMLNTENLWDSTYCFNPKAVCRVEIVD